MMKKVLISRQAETLTRLSLFFFNPLTLKYQTQDHDDISWGGREGEIQEFPLL